MTPKITMQQLASEAGVSTATVSRVLTRNPLVSEETRKRVQELIDRYDYRPNSVARSLVRQQSNMLGMLVQDISNPYFAAMYLQAEKLANQRGYTLLMTSSLSFQNERESILALIERQVDGMIIISTNIDMKQPAKETLEFMETARRKLPIILINEPVRAFAGPYVAPENREGYLAATRYLLSLGHRELAFIGGNDDTNTVHLRYSAFCDALSEYGLASNPALTCMTGYTADSGVQGMLHFLETGHLPDAVITFNDLVALGVLKVCTQQNLRVPDDISIISCDNSYISRGLMPELTSIDIQPELQGEKALEALLKLMEAKEVPQSVIRIPAKLIVRGSTARPRRA
ncbi:MAG: LacI family transcriptional regulator [Eubacteriales bacterium]|nr:LacI family transcriptional regulator [Eubacteriales bacterium]